MSDFIIKNGIEFALLVLNMSSFKIISLTLLTSYFLVSKVFAVISEAKEEQVSTLCYNMLKPQPNEMRDFLESKKLHRDETLVFPKFVLTDDAYYIELLESIINVDPYQNFSYDYNFPKEIRQKHKNWKEQFYDYGCRDVFCYSEKLFGKELALRILYMKAKYGFNSSPFNFLGATSPRVEDFDFILSVLSDLPDNFYPVINYRKNFRLTFQKENEKSKSVWADNAIRIYPSFLTKPRDRQRRILIHEIGHNIQRMNLKLDDDQDWLKIGGWKKKEKRYGQGATKTIWKTTGSDQSPIDFGRLDPYEDFAVTFSQYRYRGDWLKKVSPKRYDYMKKKVFQGVEYLSSTCLFEATDL